MQSYALLAFVALASAQSSSISAAASAATSVSEDPLNSYLTMTNSNGVITGIPTQPAVVTSQPSVVTSQPLPASIYAGLTTGLNTVIVGNQTVSVSIGSGITSIVKSTPKPTAASSTGGSGASGSGTASGSAAGASSSGSAATHFKAGAGALAGFGAMFAFLL